ncbi:MAG TPA: L-threonylcarbamoyladenylate synthase, partial [Candidatus Omnitrophota bacterium]|nr:L-threonylcarbamoyladenylate synthase [Candidatus Omnitrophota bacterium]
AMARLRAVKQRAEDKPFSIHIWQKSLVYNYTSMTDPKLYKLIDTCWPGPVTVIVPDRTGNKTIGIRMPQNNIALMLLQESQCTVAAPSANLAGKPAPSTCGDALRDLDGRIDIAIDGGPAVLGKASSVVDFTGETPKVVRQGAISQEDVDRITGKKTILFICTGNSCRSVMAEYLLRQALQDRDGVEIQSAGTGVFLRSPASQETMHVLARRGIDASMHVSQPVTNVLLNQADLILVMTRTHRQQILERLPAVENRVYLLGEFNDDPAVRQTGPDIPDPIGKPAEAYEGCLLFIQEAVEKLVKLI